MFVLDPRLEQDTAPVAAFPLCRVLLMRDARYPWLILVPTKPDLTELHDLEPADRARLFEEISDCSRVLQRLFDPKKINVGALGNIVRQLHIHVVARQTGDPAWPGPVWGHSEAVPYAPDELSETLDRIAAELANAAPTPPAQ